MIQKPKIRKIGGSKRVVELPEELTGRQLRSWVRRKHIHLLHRKMRRIKNLKGEQIKEGVRKQNRELKLIRSYSKDHPPMQRIRKPKTIVFTRIRNKS